MEKTKELVLLLLVTLCFGTLVSNYFVFKNLRVQQIVVKDNARMVPQLSIEEALKYDFNYPNINAFTVPFKTYIGRVYLRDTNYSQAISFLHQGRKNNPYLMMSENYLAEIYDILEVKDSFDYYSKLIYKNVPNNFFHFSKYIKSLGQQSNTEKIDSLFNLQLYKSELLWKAYLASIVNIDSKSFKAKENLSRAIKLFPKENEIENLVDVNLFGYDKIKKSEQYVSVSDQLAQKGNFEGAVKVLKEAIKLYPKNLYFEKIATSYYKLKDYQNTLIYIDSVNTSKSYPQGRYHLIKGVSLCELGKIDEGCSELTKAIIAKNPQATKAKSIYCR